MALSASRTGVVLLSFSLVLTSLYYGFIGFLPCCRCPEGLWLSMQGHAGFVVNVLLALRLVAGGQRTLQRSIFGSLFSLASPFWIHGLFTAALGIYSRVFDL